MAICHWLLGKQNLSRALVFVCALTVSACAQPIGPDPVEGDLVVERLALEFNTGFEEADQFVIRNALEWTIAWARIYQNGSSKPPLPGIDFSKEQVVLATLGRRPSSGFVVQITGASRTGDTTAVRLESRSPGPGCGVLTVETKPVDVVKMPRTPGDVVFEKTSVVKTCG